MVNKIISTIIRLIFLGIIILTSFYCLLAYPPFTYQQVIKLELVTWLPIFVKAQPYLYLVASALLIPILLPSLKVVRTKKITQVFIIANSFFSIVLIFRPLLSRLENSINSLVWCFITTLPLFCLIVIDYLSYYPKVVWAKNINEQEDKKVFLALIKTALFISLIYFAIFHSRLSDIDFHPTISQEVFTLVWSFSTHLVMFMAMFAIFNLIRALARLSSKAAILEFWLIQLLAILLVTWVFKGLIFAAIGFNNFALLFALIFAALLVTFFSSLSILLIEKPVETVLGLLLKPFTYQSSVNQVKQVCFLAALVTTTYLLTIKFVALDWNFLLQKLIAIVVWLFTFAHFYSSKSLTTKPPRVILMLLFALLSLISYKTISILENQIFWQKDNQSISLSQLIDKYTGYDISARLLKDIFVASNPNKSFYKFLQNSSNISSERKVNPVDINLVENLSNKETEKPNIFIFTIDSLRQDYIRDYNRSVTFTPFIDAFAKESIVMENSFSHYGATGLSEPSIWVGGMLLHKQYVTPFYSMNSLEKLLEVENYQSFISIDSILETIVKPSPNITQIDKGISTQSLNLCRSLEELKEKIINRTDKTRPVFVYTQPQNLHVSVINRENRTVLDKDNYGDFYAPYASRVKRIDQCFGDFINFLKSQGMFENSIIVFTADHGESLGEEGRFGHAYTIFPEILKIPLIIHIPNKLRDSIVWDTKAIAFSSDITPSLYYLLGHKPVAKHQVLGRPLFTSTMEEQKGYLQESYLVASSYGAVYGLLNNNGESLYIADGVNFQDYFYDLANDPRGRTNIINPEIKQKYQHLIRQHIEVLNKFYEFTPDD